MPKYKVNGSIYNIPDDKVEAFEKKHPDALVDIYDNNSTAYSIPISKRDSFQKKYDKWSYSLPEETKEEQPAQQTPVQEAAAAPAETQTPLVVEQEDETLTEQERNAMITRMNHMRNSAQQTLNQSEERMNVLKERGVGLGDTTQKGKMRFDPESGKFEQTYTTPAGNTYSDKAIADMESFRFRQAADMSVGGQIRRANQKLTDLKEKRAQSASRVHEETAKFNEEKLTGLGRALIGGQMYVGMQQGDKENSALDVAIRQTEELIKDLEEQKDREQGKDVGFWRGFGRTVGDVRNWDFGISDMGDAMTMMHADKLTGEDATEGERAAYDEMMGSIHNKQEVEQMYGGNAGFWNRAGVMTGYMPSFMLDFALTGGGFSGINTFTKAGAKTATKVIGKEIAEEMATQGVKTFVKNNGVKGAGLVATDWTIKALGTTANDLLVRAPLMTNTVQLGKITADIIDRKLGDVVVDENGNYDFSNDKTWGSAIWQGEANAIVENYSEMFGAHLDPVMSLNNMSKLANVVGAKRLGGVLAKADAVALNGIMGTTNDLFSKMGVSDYVGEVSEEYYGQLWRTMLNLDDAYQENADGTRTNLLATKQFHGDIWGGMVLSMGLMNATKHTLTATNYTSMKFGVTKADNKASELLGKDTWELLRGTLDLTTNENIGDIAELIVKDQEFTNEEKAAVLEYMERSMNLRGFNLGTMRQDKNPTEQQADESYLDGYNASSPQEMNDAKNLYEYHRQQIEDVASDGMMSLIEQNPIEAIAFVNSNDEWNDEERNSVLDYINAKQVYNGMIQRVRDDIDGRIEQSNSMIDARVNRKTGDIQGATMKADDRKVYIVNGNVESYPDIVGIDVKNSDNSIIIRDAETGALEQVSPEAILYVDERQNPDEQKELTAQTIREQFAQEAANKIDGAASFNPGDTYSVVGEDGQQAQVQVAANEVGVIDNGDGTVNVTDGTNIFPIAKDVIQQQVDAENIGRVAEFEKQRAEENILSEAAKQEASRPQYAMNDLVALSDENGNSIRGSITADIDADGKYEVHTEEAINGKRVNMLTRDELDSMLMEHNGEVIEKTVQEMPETVQETAESVQEMPESVQEEQPIPAMERIPKDEQGNPLYEQSDSDTAWDAIVEQTEGDEAIAQSVADGMVSDKEAELKKVEKAKPKGGTSIAEKIAAEKERKATIDDAKRQVDIWKKIAQTSSRRKQAVEAERRRVAEEAAALRKAEEEKLRAEREEAERIEREALNGVPDMVDDTPGNARARGYRRLNGHKIDRQEPVQAIQGKEVAVKFADNRIEQGRVAIIDASQLQHSHIQGQRNPLHFIDEAQPKERNDEASIASAQKIAKNIRPEEITSSVTAYTGAPTVNTRGEVIQGNNRSNALNLMWSGFNEQAEQYKQYLKDHAEEFGLNAEDIDKMEKPVLVNMLDVEDADAISLGQYVAQDTESGGIERIKPKNAVQKMGVNMRSFANLLLKSADEEMSFAGLVDSNGATVLKWMSQKGYITPTQYKSAFDTKGNITPEAKNDLRSIMYQSVFQGGSTRLEEMFNAMPAKAQRAILATAFRDYDSANTERLSAEIQNSIRAYHALAQDKMFAEAKNFKEVRIAVEGWKRQYQIDDVTGESYLPAENFSNFALHLAAMYKGESQSLIQSTFNKLYDLIQGTQEETLFEQPDNTPRTLAQAIYEILNLEYNGQQRSNVLVSDSTASQDEQGSNGTIAPRERVEDGNESTDNSRGTESSSGQSGSVAEEIAAAEAETETNPTEKQKEAGNYKKGHVQIGTFNVTIENPKGSVRSGVDVNGEKWEIEMQNTYGYIRGTQGVDGDHIDVFLTDNIDGWNGRRVFIVDQYNPDGTFDEHKVLLGFNEVEEAQEAYLSNYSKGWDAGRKLVYSSANIEDFEKWIASSHRKTKPFAEYKSVKSVEESNQNLKHNLSDFKVGDVVLDYYIKKLYRVKKHTTNGISTIAELDAEGSEVSEMTYNSNNNARFSLAEAPAPKQTETTSNSLHSITPAQYTTKRGKVLDMHLVKPGKELSKDEIRNAKELAKGLKGWYDREKGGFMMRSEEDAQQIVDALTDESGEKLDEVKPISLADTRETVPQQEKEEVEVPEEKAETPAEEKPTNEGAIGLVSDERMAELKERLRKKLGAQLNVGIDPELLAIGMELAAGYIDRGVRKFSDFSKQMIEDLGDVIRPYLKAFYNGARDLPEIMDNGLSAELTSYDEVRTFDVANFDKGSTDVIAMAEQIANEATVEKQTEQAKTEIKANRKKSKKKSISSHTEHADLFGGLFDDNTITDKNKNDGLQGNDGVRSERVSADNSGHEQGLPRETESDSESQSKESRGLDNGRKGTSKSADRSVRLGLSDSVKNDAPAAEPKNTNNNHSERGANHAPTSVDARIDANIKAIEIAQQLIESGEKATPEQMSELRKFSGWGGLGKAFSENRYSARIQSLLGAEGYQQAVMSANSAYYTPAYVVDTLWDIAERMGFKGGNILEGSAGIGNILGQIPTHINEQSDIHAVEIDGTSGNILSLLYPDAKVEIQGFESTRIPNGSVDLSITNVPFVTGLRVNDTTGDKDLSKKFHNIHDFCIAKNVRKLREGGIGIFISSNGTLDSSKKLRDWIANEGGSDFVGAFRMNNKTFGGTGVTSDIIVIRKRVNSQKSANAIDVSSISGERMTEYDTGETRKVKGKQVPIIKQLSMDYNRYFIEHPENMAGEMRFAFEKGDTFRPTSKGLYPTQEKNQEKMLSEFVESFKAEEFSDKSNDETNVAEVMGGKKVGEMFVRDGKLYINSTASAQPLTVNANKVKGHTKEECFNAYAAIKDALADVLSYQTENESNEGLQPLLDKLNAAYDDFVKTYGHFNKNTAIAFLRNDVDFPNVFSLEKYEETGDKSGNKVQTFGKTDIFSQRVIEKEKEPTPTNVKDGIVASVFKFGRIDIPYIAEQLGKSDESIKKEILENGLGFEEPTTRQMELSYKYLSGNVREKLRQAQENNENGEYDRNIKALQDVIPMNIPAHLIDFTLGSSWIEPKLYSDYVKERTDIEVSFTAAGGSWYMKAPEWGLNKEQNRSMGVFSERFQKTIFGHTLIEAAIQNKSVTVSQTRKSYDGSTETITDKDATQACAAKIDEIRQDFKEWARGRMQSDAEMSERMERVYNDTFNNYVPISIPDDFVPERFGGASHKFKMRPHQSKAIVRGTMQPLLLAHEVGTGKTFTLISTAMEMRRLGTARKPMIVVQNATVGQFVASAKELYPNAKILTLEESDRSADGRMNFYAKIRYNDWDMIVVPQSTFEFIPDSEERQMAFVQDKIEEKMLVLEQMKDADPDGRSFITRQAEKEIEQLQEQLAGLTNEASKKRTAADEKKRAVSLQNAEVKALEMLDRRTDDVENFDDMGIDALLVDEAHEYKHLGFATAMQRGVKGVDPSYSKKSQGVYLKTQAVLEKNNGRNVIFATGTPISNTAAEIWTFMRYLMPADTMKEYGIYYFDDFVRNFGNIQQMLEFTTSGKFKENNRFAGYVNLPELVRIWSGVSDTVLTKEAGGVSDKIPELEDGKAQDLYLPQTRALRSIMKYVKAQLEEYEKMSGKEKKANSHIPLTMYGLAKAAAVDARLVDSNAEDDTNSKTNEAVRQTLRSLEDAASYKGTVAIFADNYQNKRSGFNIYEDIREKLIAEGVSPNEIVVMKSGMSVKKKLEIFNKVNRGEVRVVLGSTFTLGTGVNIQERLHTLIHLDAPNRPMDYTQRNGRILRQGNLHKDMGKAVRVLRFGVEDSLDVTAYQRLKTKGAIADSIMNGKQMMLNSMSNRVLEEEEDVFGDTVAQLSGSEYAMLKNNAEKNVRKFESRKKQWEADQTYIHNAKPRLKGQIAKAEQRIEQQNKRSQIVQKTFPNGTLKEITSGKQSFATVDSMTEFIKEHNKSILAETKKMKDGGASVDTQTRKLTISFNGMPFEIKTVLSKEMNRSGGQLFAEVQRKMTYSCPELELEDVPVHQSLLRNAIEDITENVITGKDFAEAAETAERGIKHSRSELEQLQSREGKAFEYDKELAQAKSQYEEYTELMKKEMQEKEAKYAEMDNTIDEVSDLSEIDSEDDGLYRSNEREGDGAYTDDEVSYENDPIAKALGKPRHTRKQRKEFAERERGRMVDRVESLAKKLGLDNVEIVTDSSTLEGKKQQAKGFYSKSTGKITIVIPNNTSVADVEQTLLHEAVAHYGLRQLFGEHFDTFLDNVFNNANENVRSKIVALASKNDWDFRKATEEYLAGLAENTNFEDAHKASWWQKIKSFFLDMLHKIGFEDFKGVTLTDNELRYILWRSYENLAEPGRHRSILGEAADISKQYELKVGSYAVADSNSTNVAENDDTLYRDGDPEMHERILARNRYEERVKRGMYQTQEALQDSMLGLREAMEAILGKGTRIEEVEGFENAYLGENRLSSVNKAEADAIAQTLFKPMLDEVAKLAKSKAEREELTDYMMAKHGIERNRVMAERDYAEYTQQYPTGKKTLQDFRGQDYAGLTALTGLEEVSEAEREAQEMIDSYEDTHETADLWEKVNAVSKATLQKSYECGMMDKKTFEKVSAMYEFYIPLRGFDEKTSAEAYAYLTHKQSAFNAPIKTAQGRKSKADDPFANLQSMAESAIMQGNRNKLVKQRFLNFALNHPSDLVSVSDLWLEYDAVANEWKPVFADNIEIDDTPDEVEQKMFDFEEKMNQLAEAEPDRYKRGKDAADVPYRVVESKDMRQHQVVVKRNGRDYVVTINGNPRAAQALNGQTNPDNDTSGHLGAILRAGETVNRQLSAFYTTRNPDFIVSNFMRDMLYTNTMAWIKESPNYALRFHRNYGMANPVTMKSLLAKHRKGTLDMSNKTEAMFHQFMMNGGETGYANVRDIEQHKNDIRKELKKANGKVGVRRALSWLGERFDELNRAVENCARFAAFMTSREMGRTIDRAIYDAKEISVNFNKKGSGAKFYDETGQTKIGNAAALTSGLGRSGFVFWNAAIQGTANFGRQFKRHPAKAFAGSAVMFLLGALVASLGGDDDEDDKNAYYNLPEYVRRSNILFSIGDHWISIPLPIEYRAIYGMGELMTSILNGKEHLTGGEIAEAIAGQATQILPIDFLEGGGGLNAFIPSAVKPVWEAYVVEKSWTGMPLYKNTPFNKDMPEWTKAYKSANKYIVGLANVMNETTGGDPYTKGSIDINPAKVEYMLNGYFGGVFSTIDKMTKTAETIAGQRDYDPRSILLVNRLVKAGDESTEYRAVNNEYFRLKEEHDRLKARLKNYESDTDNGVFDYAEKIDFLYNSPDYERFEIFEDYRKDIDALYEELKEAIDDEERKDVEAELNEVKKELIEEANQTRKRK